MIVSGAQNQALKGGLLLAYIAYFESVLSPGFVFLEREPPLVSFPISKEGRLFARLYFRARGVLACTN